MQITLSTVLDCVKRLQACGVPLPDDIVVYDDGSVAIELDIGNGPEELEYHQDQELIASRIVWHLLTTGEVFRVTRIRDISTEALRFTAELYSYHVGYGPDPLSACTAAKEAERKEKNGMAQA